MMLCAFLSENLTPLVWDCVNSQEFHVYELTYELDYCRKLVITVPLEILFLGLIYACSF